MAKNNRNPEAEMMTFEQCLAELETIVAAMERGDVPLADALVQYERGVLLIRRCRSLLSSAEKKIELLTEDEKGALSTEPISPPTQEDAEQE